MRPLPKFSPITRYDLLIWAGGEPHALHTIVRKGKARQGKFIICSCSDSFEVPDSRLVDEALKNVPEIVPT